MLMLIVRDLYMDIKLRYLDSSVVFGAEAEALSLVPQAVPSLDEEVSGLSEPSGAAEFEDPP